MGKSNLLSRKKLNFTISNGKKSGATIASAILGKSELEEAKTKAKKDKYLSGFYTGKFKDSNLLVHIRGLEILRMIVNGGLEAYDFHLKRKISSQNRTEDTAKRSSVQMAKYMINDIIFDINRKIKDRYEISKSEYEFEQISDILDVSRNVIEEERVINGKKVKKKMDQESGFRELERLTGEIDKDNFETIEIYAKIGSDLISFLGIMTEIAKEDKKDAIIWGAASSAVKAVHIAETKKLNNEDEKKGEKTKELWQKYRNAQINFLHATPTNKEDRERLKKEYIDTRREYEELQRSSTYYLTKTNALVYAILGFRFVSQLNKNKKQLDASTISTILLDILSKEVILRAGQSTITNIIKRTGRNKWELK